MEKIEGLDAGLLKEEVATALIASHLHESCKGIINLLSRPKTK